MTEQQIDRLVYLYGRWQDECGYEAFEEYQKAMKAILPTTIELTSNPFCVTYLENGIKHYATVTPDGEDHVTVTFTKEAK